MTHNSHHRLLSSHYSPFFFLILRPPPRSTLFPYTTLFRSKRSPQFLNSRKSLLPFLAPACLSQYATELDRKSTRLNSSHSQISYAVFCLKKKKNRIIIFRTLHPISTRPLYIPYRVCPVTYL